MEKLILKAKYLVKIALWILSGYLGREVSLEYPHKLIVLITYFNPVRMKSIDYQIRNILKCTFVERIIISNHNPDVDIRKKLSVRDSRVTILNQVVRRGCGYRWHVATEFDPKYLVVIDDDFLIFPRQLACLFRYLVAEQEIPHGLSGMNYLPDGSFEFRDKEDREVDFLCEIYAVTNEHLKQYQQINSRISSNGHIARIVDSAADFMVLSQTGTSRPKIHNVGRLLRDETFKMEGVAVHKDQSFDKKLLEVLQALRRGNQDKTRVAN